MSKDFSNLIKSFITAIFWLSGILWNINGINIGWLKNILILNPVTFIVEGYRNCLINKIWFWEEPNNLFYFVIILIILLALSLWTYKKLRKEIPDVLN